MFMFLLGVALFISGVATGVCVAIVARDSLELES